jgi:hypothetical protein
MARFIALPVLSCLPNAGRSAVARPVKRKLLGDIVCQRDSSSTQLARFGEEENIISLRSWPIAIGIRCSSGSRMKSRRSVSQPSVVARMAIRFGRQRRSPYKPREISSLLRIRSTKWFSFFGTRISTTPITNCYSRRPTGGAFRAHLRPAVPGTTVRQGSETAAKVEGRSQAFIFDPSLV